ncbi:MAG: hypothetical protein LC659_00545 [Myxococcales bacterium]|nr:hypothetical protein [Myxococcales bacterium]
MDRFTSLLLRLTPDERVEMAREVAARVSSPDDDAVERAWLDALERRFGDDDELAQLPLWATPPDAR